MPFHPWALPLAWQLQNYKAHLAFSEKSRGVIGLDCLTCFKMLTARFHAVRHLYSRLETQERHSSSLRIFNSFKIKKREKSSLNLQCRQAFGVALTPQAEKAKLPRVHEISGRRAFSSSPKPRQAVPRSGHRCHRDPAFPLKWPSKCTTTSTRGAFRHSN